MMVELSSEGSGLQKLVSFCSVCVREAKHILIFDKKQHFWRVLSEILIAAAVIL